MKSKKTFSIVIVVLLLAVTVSPPAYSQSQEKEIVQTTNQSWFESFLKNFFFNSETKTKKNVRQRGDWKANKRNDKDIKQKQSKGVVKQKQPKNLLTDFQASKTKNLPNSKLQKLKNAKSFLIKLINSANKANSKESKTKFKSSIENSYSVRTQTNKKNQFIKLNNNYNIIQESAIDMLIENYINIIIKEKLYETLDDRINENQVDYKEVLGGGGMPSMGGFTIPVEHGCNPEMFQKCSDTVADDSARCQGFENNDDYETHNSTCVSQANDDCTGTAIHYPGFSEGIEAPDNCYHDSYSNCMESAAGSDYQSRSQCTEVEENGMNDCSEKYNRDEEGNECSEKYANYFDELISQLDSLDQFASTILEDYINGDLSAIDDENLVHVYGQLENLISIVNTLSLGQSHNVTVDDHDIRFNQ